MSTNGPTPEVSSHSNVITITDESNTLTNIVFAGFLLVSEGQPHEDDLCPSDAVGQTVFQAYSTRMNDRNAWRRPDPCSFVPICGINFSPTERV